jgi:hypothetical protein
MNALALVRCHYRNPMRVDHQSEINRLSPKWNRRRL